MKIFEKMAREGHEQVILNYDRTTGLRAFIAIHDTTLGPALGGCRMWNYATEEEALDDVLRLSKGMTFKSAVTGVDYGGGKSVIWGDPAQDKSEALFRAFGRYVECLKGRFMTGTDVGTTPYDFVTTLKETKYVGALPQEYGGGGSSGIITAYGTWKAIKAVARELYGDDSLKGKKIAVQGLGKVGYYLVGHLTEEGAEIVGCDIVQESIDAVKADYPHVEVVSPDEIYGVECDIFSPNALGSVFNDDTIPRLKCKGIAGAANNQLAEARHAQALAERDILYAPDYVANAGGLIQVADELQGYNRDRAYSAAGMIYNRLLDIFAIAKSNNITTDEAANKMVDDRLKDIGKIKRNYIG